MKRAYQEPETITIGADIVVAMLAGSDQSPYADSKKHTQIGEDITSKKIASESIPHYNVWDN